MEGTGIAQVLTEAGLISPVRHSSCQYHWLCFSIIARENVRNTAKNVKSHDFLDFEKNVKNVKNVEVITYMSIVLKTMVTTLNQFYCLSHNSKAIIF